ncbi:MAG TPA: hypothetical protein VMW10_03625 [Alphaproteobacteria bacterium]|nr:hypothetical protein [Alphaproteobacteria bacterium]
MNHEFIIGNDHLLIPGLPSSFSHPFRNKQAIPFHEARAIQLYSEDEEIRKKFPSIFPAKAVERDAELDRQKRKVSYLIHRHKNGDRSATNDLGYCHETGNYSTKINLPLAFALYKVAAREGNPFGKCNLAYCYQEGIGTDPNLEEAQRLFGEVDPDTRAKWEKARWPSKSST